MRRRNRREEFYGQPPEMGYVVLSLDTEPAAPAAATGTAP